MDTSHTVLSRLSTLAIPPTSLTLVPHEEPSFRSGLLWWRNSVSSFASNEEQGVSMS